MRKTVLWGFFVLLLSILTYSACASTPTAEAGDLRTSKWQKQPKLTYGTVKESSEPGNQGTFSGFHVVQHKTTSRKSKAIYGGANDIRRPRNGHNSANSILTRSSSLFTTTLKHLVFGLLLVLCCF
ncbi:hypothetical protein L6164_011546 [Bauhinia variegata]|uniref:Uncharacterized protein n=1 Tax=Bauhinia variegata TaxID=167791 RepID=A0ACB9P7F6_BAUVA|nr:hypothetical protein L6164_011546 [Bauhinia variegata]